MKIGITGGIGSGKTFICKIIEKMGYPVFYSDVQAKWLMENDQRLIYEIQQLIGRESFDIEKKINKKVISDFIFKNSKNRNELNKLIHPRVFELFNNWCRDNNSSALVFNESALLFETGSYKRFDKTILVTAPLEARITRLKSRDKISEIQIRARMQTQLSDEEKIDLADFIIINDENELLLPQITSIINEINL